MAPETRGQVSIDDDVTLLTEQIDALEALGRKNSVDDAEVYDFSVRWGAALAGRLPRLVHYSSLGLLDDADQHRFQSLCERLRRVSGIAERFGLPRPVLSGESAASPKGHRRIKTRSPLPKRRSRS
ncbi:hypothetical protein A5678_18350 [Mycobacterium sp. E2733]|nr:hypothetical protein A5678_18350 [Mycobacterium sp. E2733]